MKISTPLIAMLFLSILLSLPIQAQTADEQHPLLTDKYSIGIGAFIQDKDIKLRVDGRTPHREYDFDEAVGMSGDQTDGAAIFRWRFGKKWSLFGQVFDTSDSSNAVLEEDVEWEDVVFRAGTNVGAGVDMTIARIFFGRLFSASPRHEFGLGLGFHWFEFSTFIEGEVLIEDESTGFVRESVDADAPLPNIGGWYAYAPSPKWLLTARLDWLYVDIGDYSGGLWNSAVGIQYQAFEHVGFALEYNYFNLNLDVDKSDWRGAMDLTYRGPFLSVTANW